MKHKKTQKAYTSEIASKFSGEISEKSVEFNKQYAVLVRRLEKARDRKLPDNEKIETLRETQKI